MKAYSSFREVRNDLQNGTLSCRDLVKQHLSNIRDKAHLNAFLSVFEEEALRRADEVDIKINANKAGKLAGLVVGIKDVLAYQDHPLQACSNILEGFTSQYTAFILYFISVQGDNHARWGACHNYFK